MIIRSFAVAILIQAVLAQDSSRVRCALCPALLRTMQKRSQLTMKSLKLSKFLKTMKFMKSFKLSNARKLEALKKLVVADVVDVEGAMEEVVFAEADEPESFTDEWRRWAQETGGGGGGGWSLEDVEELDAAMQEEVEDKEVRRRLLRVWSAGMAACAARVTAMVEVDRLASGGSVAAVDAGLYAVEEGRLYTHEFWLF